MNLSRTTRIGALCWIVAAPLFLTANVVTGLGWHHPPYSWATNNISDLVTAALLAAGLILTWRALGQGFIVRLAQSMLLLSIAGYALAGRFPADINENLHFLGALLVLIWST